MEEVIVMIAIGFIGIVISVAAFMYILRNWDFLFETNGSFALGFSIIMCGCATGTSVLSLVFGIAKLWN